MKSSEPVRVWMAAAEAAPWLRTGGLGEVMHSLPHALARRGLAVRCFLPGYAGIDRAGFVPERKALVVPTADGAIEVRLATRREADGLEVTLVECPELFDRPHPYGPPGEAYGDNPRRFAAFSRAVCEAAHRAPRRPRVLHAHDWHAAPVALLSRHGYDWGGPPPSTVFTIHNLGYQGRFAAEAARELALGPEMLARVFHMHGIEFHGDVSFMKAGLVYADRITTVSPTYAREILSPEMGAGLDGVLRAREPVLVGILNGLDYERWNPRRDRDLPVPFGPRSLGGKRATSAALRGVLGMETDGERPLLGVVSRLDAQKGIDVLVDATPAILAHGVDLAVLGSGDPALVHALESLARQHPGHVGLRVGFDEALSHLLVGGSDLLAIPSRYEPCGLAQLQAMRYGTVPVVRRTGGLADTVLDVRADPRRGTGFCFDELSPGVLADTVGAAVDMARTRPDAFLKLVRRGMRADFSWDASAARYEALYASLT